MVSAVPYVCTGLDVPPKDNSLKFAFTALLPYVFNS